MSITVDRNVNEPSNCSCLEAENELYGDLSELICGVHLLEVVVVGGTFKAQPGCQVQIECFHSFRRTGTML